jgi:D-beta-D-heptose 7-phosphate kinase/D-beta-D-heptose 1-phosphate adenosyltransferase
VKGVDALLSAARGRRILVVGDVMLDHYIFGDATRISPEAPVPVVLAGSETDTVGGAANVANNIASLGGQVELIGGIGDDANGRKLEERLEKQGIRYDAGFRLGGARTITKTRIIVRSQQLCRLDFEQDRATYARVTAEDRRPALAAKIAENQAVILSDYGKGVLNTPAIAALVKAARQAGKFIAADPKPSSGNEYADLDLLTPNWKEAQEMAHRPGGHEEPAEILAVCRAVHDRYRPRHLAVTLGPQGMAIFSAGDAQVRIIPTAARKVYDVSGAGDTAIAALTLALTTGADLETAAHFANAAAGVVVGKLGTATVTPDELRAFAAG